MNICIVSNYKQRGYGESTRPGQLAKYLSGFGHNVLHICDWDGRKDGIEHLQIERNIWEPIAIKRILSFSRNYFKLLWFNPDLIYVHQFNNAKWATQTKLFKGKKIIFDAHTSMYFEQLHFTSNKILLDSVKIQEENICRSVDFIIAASAETKDFLQKAFSISPTKLEVVGNATDIIPIQVNLAPNNPNLICLSTLPQDGFMSNKMALEMLLEIAAETFKVNTQIQFHVIGGGEMPVAKPPNVTYTGYVKDLRQEILKADVCLMPFPKDAVCGGARNKFCDYIVLGKAVITTIEGLRGMEMLVDKKNCFVAHNVSQFVLTINHLANHKTQITSVEKGVYTIRDCFNWEDRAKKVESIFNRLLRK